MIHALKKIKTGFALPGALCLMGQAAGFLWLGLAQQNG